MLMALLISLAEVLGVMCAVLFSYLMVSKLVSAIKTRSGKGE